MKTKTIEHDFTPYQTRQLAEPNRRILAALIQAGYELRKAGLICERSGQFWESRLVIVRKTA